MNVLPVGPAVFDEDFFGAGACGRESLPPRRFGCGLEERERPNRVDCPPPEVVRVRDATSATVAQRSASTAGESEARVLSQEEQDVRSSVLAKPSDDVQFTRTSSSEQVHP